MDKSIKFYSLPFKVCSCRDDNNEPTKIAERYKEFYDYKKEGKNTLEVLNIMGIRRMCCRSRFMTIPVVPMINRSENRFFDDTNREVKKANTRELLPKIKPPEFPLL